MPHDDPTLTFPPGHEGAQVQNQRDVYLVPNLDRLLLKPAYKWPWRGRTRTYLSNVCHHYCHHNMEC